MGNDFIKAEVSKIFDGIVKIRRDIHMNPELGFEETETSQKIKGFLTEHGLEVGWSETSRGRSTHRWPTTSRRSWLATAANVVPK